VCQPGGNWGSLHRQRGYWWRLRAFVSGMPPQENHQLLVYWEGPTCVCIFDMHCWVEGLNAVLEAPVCVCMPAYHRRKNTSCSCTGRGLRAFVSGGGRITG
jgi:hypothetical protein